MDLMLLILAAAVFGVHGQIECPASLPCTCFEQEIICDGKGLIEIPEFTVTQTKYKSLRLGNNDITSIAAGAFKNLNVDHDFLLDMDNNKISDMTSGAFDGISDKLLHLYASGNRLTNVPDAVGELSNIQTLKIVDNPVSDLNDVAIQAIADTISTFHFGSEQMFVWPSGLNRLNVDSLKVKIPITSFASNSFDGQKDSLGSLEIMGAKFDQVPLKAGLLSKLHTLSISDNPLLGTDSFPTSVLNGLSDTLVSLNLPGNGLKAVPNVINHLGSLQNLDLSKNSVRFVEDEVIPDNSQLQFLGLSQCELKRFPAALSKLTQLKKLDLSSNNMKTIENMDFARLSNLVVLDIKNNPIEFIATRSFKGVPVLQVLDMSKIKLNTIPVALKDLQNLQHLDLAENSVSCTCALSWMLSWGPVASRTMNINGNCGNIDGTIADYVQSGLPFC